MRNSIRSVKYMDQSEFEVLFGRRVITVVIIIIKVRCRLL